MRTTITCAAFLLSYLAMTGCASVPMEGMEETSIVNKFNPPVEGNSGLYIYRNSFVVQALKKDVWVDGKCIGKSAPYVFFYEEVEGDKSHKVSTKFPWVESPDPDNDLLIKVKSGMNYFFEQYLRMLGGTGVELVDEEQGKEEVSELDMATKGTCRKPRKKNHDLELLLFEILS